MKIKMRKSFRKLFSCIMCMAMLSVTFAMAANEPSNWAKDEIETAISLELIPTALQSQYQQPITREQFCDLTMQLLERVGKNLGKDYTMTADNDALVFSDTKNPNVIRANHLGIVNGVGNEKFNPNGQITRQEAATMLMRAANLIAKFDELPYIYDDGYAIDSWARSAVYQAYHCGIMRGTSLNTFMPKVSYTREEAFSVSLRMYNLLLNTESLAQPFLYPMTKDGVLWGYVDASGAWVIPPRYSYASEWSGEYGVVSAPDTQTNFYVIDRNGNRVATDNSTSGNFFAAGSGAVPFIKGRILIVTGSGGYTAHSTGAYALPEGKELIAPDLVNVFQGFSDGLFRTTPYLEAGVVYKDRSFNTIANGDFLFGGLFYNGIAFVQRRGADTCEVIDRNGRSLYPAKLHGEWQYASAIGDLVVTQKQATDGSLLYGAQLANGTTVLKTEFAKLWLTPAKQIVAQKKSGDPYKLYAKNGDAVYTFDPTAVPTEENFTYDGVGHYIFKASTTQIDVISSEGTLMCERTITSDTHAAFISGLVQLVSPGQACVYLTVNGQSIL